MHTLVAERMNMILKDDEEIDHKDRNRLNNQRDNLRSATRQEQVQNTTKRKNTASKYKGVSWWKNKWKARIVINGKSIHLGYFDNEEDAARAYDRAAKRAFGEFMVLNFPEEI
jgi:HNH endonuclease/AP2 domain